LQEQDRKSLSSISSRLYYIKELAPHIDPTLYDNAEDFSLHHVDLRWTNHCNQACVYCGPLYSSKWSQELGEKVRSNDHAKKQVKDYVFKNVKNLKNVYLAGGEPLLMKENKEFLELLLKENPNVNLRINTNLSTTATGVFELCCKFKNVHWTISVESIEEEYEYIRFHGKWQNFITNLKMIQKLQHKVSFNMLYFILNYQSLFDTVDYFKKLGFHENSFIIGPLYKPEWLNVLCLPKQIINEIKNRLSVEIDKSDWYLKNSYQNIQKYISNTVIDHNMDSFRKQISLMDKRRKTDWRKIFTKVNDVATN
jgi:MoaA/NifB/PqqE/SkfB family radical SAM enzyme